MSQSKALSKPGQFNIRQLTLSDLEAIHKIEMAVHIAPWSQALFKQSLTGDEIVYGAFVHQQLVGYMVVKTLVDEIELLNVAVNQVSQGQGVASQLLNYLFDFALSHSVDKVFLEVRRSNISAIKLYHNLGFEQVGCRKNYYPSNQLAKTREDALVMQKTL